MTPVDPTTRQHKGGVSDEVAQNDLLAAALVAAVAAGCWRLAACGSAAARARHRARAARLPAGVQTPATESLTGGKQAAVLNESSTSEDFEHLDPGQAYFQLDYEIMYATQRSLYSYKPNTFSDVDSRHGRRPGEALRWQQADHDQHPQGRSLQPAGQPRSDRRRRRLRDRARRQPERRQPVLPRLSRARSKA